MTERWFWAARARPAAEARLVCIPYAGGAASVFRGWHHLAPPDVAVCPVELPGRGGRMDEEPFLRMPPLVHALADALEPLLDRPFVLFGHSMGGLVAFELTRLLRRRGWPEPCHLFVAASPAPDTPRPFPPIHQESDAVLKERLHTFDGTPPEALADNELMALVLPVIRADFAVIETYDYREEPPLEVPSTVLGGIHDRTVRFSELDRWRRHLARAELRMLPSGHFFVNDLAPDLMRLVVAQLDHHHDLAPAAFGGTAE